MPTSAASHSNFELERVETMTDSEDLPFCRLPPLVLPHREKQSARRNRVQAKPTSEQEDSCEIAFLNSLITKPPYAPLEPIAPDSVKHIPNDWPIVRYTLPSGRTSAPKLRVPSPPRYRDPAVSKRASRMASLLKVSCSAPIQIGVQCCRAPFRTAQCLTPFSVSSGRTRFLNQ